MIIAVDGPAASGKGTIARALAAHYGLPYLDTGLLYRAVGVSIARAGDDPSNESVAALACNFNDTLLAEPALRTEQAGALASLISSHAAVRSALLDRQRAFAAQQGGAVLDGRDIGTVIAPNAHAKLFVTASPEVRARRRHAEESGRELAEIYADICARDVRDSRRAAAPLMQAADADLLDTTNLTIPSAIQAAISMVEARLHPTRI